MEPLVLLVVGSTLASEVHDRPAAYALRDDLLAWLAERGVLAHERVVVVSDLWYMCRDDLRTLPAISIGGPEANALTAHLADKLPGAFVIDDLLMVQADLDFTDLLVACWGVSHDATARACRAFVDRYLDAFMREAARGLLGAAG